MSELSSSIRLQRNLAEKQRRDKLNGYVNELGNLVPMVSMAAKRLDKTSILRLSAAYLRLKQSSLNGNHDSGKWRPRTVSSDFFRDLFEAVDGFVIVTNGTGKILFVSQSVERYLGHQNIEMIGHSLNSFLHPADHESVFEHIHQAYEEVKNGQTVSERVSFRCRLRERNQPRSEVITYQMVHITGHFALCDAPILPEPSTSQTHNQESNSPACNNRLASSPSRNNLNKNMNASSLSSSSSSLISHNLNEPGEIIDTGHLMTASSLASAASNLSILSASAEHKLQPRDSTIDNTDGNFKEDSNDDDGSSINQNANACNGLRILFKGFVQVIKTNPMAELSLMDANLDEYVSRHTLDGTLLFADHRISIILGHTPDEVIGQSAYDYILPDDHSIALFAHRLMLSNSNGTGIIVHRLRGKDGEPIFLQSSGCLQYDRNTGQVDHFVCVSRFLVPEEGDKERQKFVKRFTPHISNSSPAALYESLQIVIGPNKSTKRYLTGTFEGTGFSNQSQTRTEPLPSPPATTPASFACPNSNSSSYGSPLANAASIASVESPTLAAPAPSSTNAFVFENGTIVAPHSPLQNSQPISFEEPTFNEQAKIKATSPFNSQEPLTPQISNSSPGDNSPSDSTNGAPHQGSSGSQQYPIDPNGPQPGLLFQMQNISVENATSGPELHIQKAEFRYMPANMTSEERASHAAQLRNELNILLQQPQFQLHAQQTGRKAYYIKPPTAPSAAAGSPRDLPSSSGLSRPNQSALQPQQTQQMEQSYLGLDLQALDSASLIGSPAQVEGSLLPRYPNSNNIQANRQPCKRRSHSPLLSSTSSAISPSDSSPMPYLIDPNDSAQPDLEFQVPNKRRKTDLNLNMTSVADNNYGLNPNSSEINFYPDDALSCLMSGNGMPSDNAPPSCSSSHNQQTRNSSLLGDDSHLHLSNLSSNGQTLTNTLGPSQNQLNCSLYSPSQLSDSEESVSDPLAALMNSENLQMPQGYMEGATASYGIPSAALGSANSSQLISNNDLTDAINSGLVPHLSFTEPQGLSEQLTMPTTPPVSSSAPTSTSGNRLEVQMNSIQ